MSSSDIIDHETFVLSSDDHEFIGCVFDIFLPVNFSFDTFREIQQFEDCLYVFQIEKSLGVLIRRVESLNLVGTMLNIEELPIKCYNGSISRYDWLNIIMDIFLTRFVSITDCCLFLSNDVLEFGQPPQKVRIGTMRKVMNNTNIWRHIEEIFSIMPNIRAERNVRLHRGLEREFALDDTIFRAASLFESSEGGVGGIDRSGEKIDVTHYYTNALADIRADFNNSCQILQEKLDSFYDALYGEFLNRFQQKYSSSSKKHRIYGENRRK